MPAGLEQLVYLIKARERSFLALSDFVPVLIIAMVTNGLESTIAKH